MVRPRNDILLGWLHSICRKGREGKERKEREEKRREEKERKGKGREGKRRGVKALKSVRLKDSDRRNAD